MYILLFSYIYSAYRPNYIQIITPSGKNLHLGSNVLSESNSILHNYNIFFNTSGISTSQHSSSFRQRSPSWVKEKYIWRLSSSPNIRSMRPFFSTERITFDVLEWVSPNCLAISPEESLGSWRRQHKSIPSFRQSPYLFSNLVSKSVIAL